MNDKGILLFDIDQTLLDTDKASEKHNKKILQILGDPDKKEYQRIKDAYKNSLSNQREYDPEVIYKKVCERFNFDNLNSLLDVYYEKENWFIYRESVFPEVKECLEKLKNNYRFGIYSEGVPKFQNNKFQAMGITEHFDSDLIFIVDAKDNVDTISKLPKNSVVIDDKQSICEYLNDNGIGVVWLNRKDSKASNKFKTIHNLMELPIYL